MMNPAPSADMKKQIFVVIHGHFYQPPRDNPWTQTIPYQESARPYHDWNERITAECYQANTRARVLDEQGKILDLKNNFAQMNFNIGPTLLAWLESSHPQVYQKILEADRKSCETYQGHGNAIAQAYNHMILPLASERDKVTQILWGLREFRHRFGREPESLWLPETAINIATLRCLIEHGLKYVILSPTQANMVRKIGDRTWTDVSDNSIDPTQPYRLFLPEEAVADEEQTVAPVGAPVASAIDDDPPEKYLDVFFYDGALANDISFNHVLRDANSLARRLQEIGARSPHPHVLVHLATDGEIYGHHEPNGERSLALLLTSKLPGLQIEVTNYGRYLALHPPTMEVELKMDEQDEGTSWGCSHGVGRWYRDCGCCVSNPPGWNQKWRTPLRKGFDILRDALAEVFEHTGGALLHDPWAARNDYIECILDPSEPSIEGFLSRHARHALNDEERALVLRLCEAQKYVLFAYTSCAWFFNDISGLEPLQNMRYAARALQLMEGLAPQNVETLMVEAFREAKSNLPEMGTGKDLYLKTVQPDVYTPERAANQFLLEQLIQRQTPAKKTVKRKTSSLTADQEQRLHIYTIHIVELRTWQDLTEKHVDPQAAEEAVSGANTAHPPLSAAGHEPYDPNIYSGVLQVSDAATHQTWNLLFTAFTDHNLHPVSYLKRIEHDDEFTTLTSAVQQRGTPKLDLAERPKIALFLERSGLQCYTLADFYAEDRERLFGEMLEDYGRRIEDPLETVYKDSLDVLEYLTSLSLQVPPRFQASVEFALEYHLMMEMEKLYSKEVGQYSPAVLRGALEKILRLSQGHRLTLDTALLKQRLTQAITQYIARLAARFLVIKQGDNAASRGKMLEEFLRLLRETLDLIEQAKSFGVAVEPTELQNMTYDILEDTLPRYLSMLETALKNAGQTENEHAHHELHRFFQEYKFMQACLGLAKRLNFNIDRYREYLISAELTMQI